MSNQPMAKAECVYFLFDPMTFEVKIGKTHGDPKKRVGSLKSGNPRLELIGHVDGKESEFHARFAELRTNREFFKAEGALLNFLSSTFPSFQFRRASLSDRPPLVKYGDVFDAVVKSDDLDGMIREFRTMVGLGQCQFVDADEEDGGMAASGELEEADEDFDDYGCRCDFCVATQMAEEICEDADFIYRACFLRSERSVFIYVKPWLSKPRQRILARLGDLADEMGTFDILSIGQGHFFDQQHYVLHLNPWIITGPDPTPEPEFWRLFAEYQRQEYAERVAAGAKGLVADE